MSGRAESSDALLHCDGCGRELVRGEGQIVSKTETYGQMHYTVNVRLCPECLKERGNTGEHLMSGFKLLIVGLLIFFGICIFCSGK
jgi:hypothetical protein